MEAAADRAQASMKPALVLVGTALVVFVLDQVSKAVVAASVSFGDRIEVIGRWIQLWHVRNEGAAFGLFQGQTVLFVAVSVVAVGMVAYFHLVFRGRRPWLHALLGLVLAGTLGNVADRIRLGYVVDFVSVGINDLRWPTFNVADSAVVVGVILLVAYLTFVDRRPGEQMPEGN